MRGVGLEEYTIGTWMPVAEAARQMDRHLTQAELWAPEWMGGPGKLAEGETGFVLSPMLGWVLAGRGGGGPYLFVKLEESGEGALLHVRQCYGLHEWGLVALLPIWIGLLVVLGQAWLSFGPCALCGVWLVRYLLLWRRMRRRLLEVVQGELAEARK